MSDRKNLSPARVDLAKVLHLLVWQVAIWCVSSGRKYKVLKNFDTLAAAEAFAKGYNDRKDSE